MNKRKSHVIHYLQNALCAGSNKLGPWTPPSVEPAIDLGVVADLDVQLTPHRLAVGISNISKGHAEGHRSEEDLH